jgi:membrane fusion protein (multidrug efflux system)
VPSVAVLAAIVLYLTGGRYVSTDDAYVKADVLTVSTDVAGSVAEIGVRENEVVAAGQMLYRLDDTMYRIALAAAEARLAAVRNEIEVSRATYRQKLAESEAAQADVAYYQREYDRVSPLVRSNAATQSQVDAAERALKDAKERLNSLREQAAATLADLGGKVDVAVDDHPRVRAAAASRDLAQRDLAHTRVVAPTAGIATRTENLRPGLYLVAAAPAMALVESGDVWVEASPKETDLTHVRPGQRVTVTIDAYPGRSWRGEVATISPASGAQFALIPAQNASGNWVKVVQRIPVRIALPRLEDAPPLRAGMSATARIDTGYRRGLGDLVGAIGGWFGFGG